MKKGLLLVPRFGVCIYLPSSLLPLFPCLQYGVTGRRDIRRARASAKKT